MGIKTMAKSKVIVTQVYKSAATGAVSSVWVDCSAKVHGRLWIGGESGNIYQSEFYSKASGKIVGHIGNKTLAAVYAVPLGFYKNVEVGQVLGAKK